MLKKIILFLCIIMIQLSITLAQGYDAIIISMCKDCNLYRSSGAFNLKSTKYAVWKLYKGDLIKMSKNDKIAIQITNSTSIIVKSKKDNNGYELRIEDYQPSKQDKYESYEYFLASATSRGAEDVEPPSGASILYNSPFNFSWGDTNRKTIKITDAEQNIVYQNVVKGKFALTLTPNDIGMEPGKDYFWKLDDKGTQYVFNIIDEKLITEIKENISQTLCISISENKNYLEVEALFGDSLKTYKIYDPENIFESCKKIDEILSRLMNQNETSKIKCESQIDLLSNLFISPIENFIQSCNLINIQTSLASIKIPFEFLKIQNSYIYKSKPVVYSKNKINIDNIAKLNLKKGFIVSDSSADPDSACKIISQNINQSLYKKISEINLDAISKIDNKSDFLLMSVHGILDNDLSCVAHIKLNKENLNPTDFSNVNFKLVYFDSCHLGLGKNFTDHFTSLGTEYFLGPIISNEAGNSSTKTIVNYFKFLEKYNPVESLFKTKQLLKSDLKGDLFEELWFAAPFRIYKLN